MSEQVDGDRANVLKFLSLVGILFQVPRLCVFNVRVGTIGKFHDQPHGASVVAVFVGFGNRFPLIGCILEQTAIIRVLGRQAGVLHELGRTRRKVHDFANQVRIDFGDKVLQVQVNVVQLWAQFGRVVVTQPGWVKVFQIRRRFDERALAFGHLFATDGQETVDVNFGRQVVASGLQHRWPEQAVEVLDVLAQEMMDFCFVTFPPRFEILAVLFAPFFGRGDVTDRSIKPDVPKVFAIGAGYFETEIWFGSRDIPVAQLVLQEVSLQVVGDFVLQVFATLSPLVQEFVQLLDLDEVVIRFAFDGRFAADGTNRIDQVRCAVSRTALVAVVAVLVLCSALGTGSFDETIWQGLVGVRIEQLSDFTTIDQILIVECGPDFGGDFAIGLTVRAAVMIVADPEPGEVGLVSVAHLLDKFFFGYTSFSSTLHDRRAVRVIGPHEDAVVPTQSLESNPDVRLHMLDHMADMNVAIGVR